MMYELIFYLKNKKNLINLLTLLIMVLALPLGMGAIREQQIFSSRASETKILFPTKAQSGSVTPTGESCVQTVNGKQVTFCKDLTVRITVGKYDNVFPNASKLSQSFDVVKKVYAQNCNEGGPECWDGQMYWVTRDRDTNELCGDPVGPSGSCGDTPPAADPCADSNNWSFAGCTGCSKEQLTCGGNYKEVDSPSGGDCTKPPNCVAADPCADSNNWSFAGCTGCSKEQLTCGGNYKEVDSPSGGDCTKPPNCAAGGGGSKKGQRCDGYAQACTTGGTQRCEAGEWMDDAGTICGYDGNGDKVGSFTTGCSVCATATDCPTGQIKCTADQAAKGSVADGGRGTLENGVCKRDVYVYAGPLNSDNVCCTTKKITAASPSECSAPAEGSTPTGIGGCCGGPADCKTGNGTSKAGDTCVTDTSKTCKSGKICQTPANANCNAYFQNGTGAKWEKVLTNIKFGDSVRVGALKAGDSNPGGYTIVSGVTLKIKGPGNLDRSLESEAYFTAGAAGEYTLEASGTCGSAKMTVVAAAPAPPVGAPATPKITGYRLAETSGAFSGDFIPVPASQDFSTGVDVTMNFSATPGQKFIFIQFKDANGTISQAPYMQSNIELLGGSPEIKNLYCSYDIQTDSLRVSAGGTDFGSQKGVVAVNNQNLSGDLIDSWTEATISAHINKPQANTSVTAMRVKVTKTDGQSDEGTCAVNLTQFDIGAKWLCGVANIRDVQNTDLSIFDMEFNRKTSEKVTISKDGTVKNTKTKLKEGSKYKICTKPPMGIRVCSDQFTFALGTIVTKLDIPIGDLNNDGCKNSLDASLLKQQFGKGLGKSADINGDGAVNSFEWGCMMQKFGKCDEEPPF